MQCDCSMAWLRDYSPVEDIQCAGPEPLEGMTISEVPLEALQCGEHNKLKIVESHLPSN